MNAAPAVASVSENAAGNRGRAQAADRYAAAARSVCGCGPAQRTGGVDAAIDRDLAAAGEEIDESAANARSPGRRGDVTGGDIAGGQGGYAAGAQGSICVDEADSDAVAGKIDVAAGSGDVPGAGCRGDAAGAYRSAGCCVVGTQNDVRAKGGADVESPQVDVVAGLRGEGATVGECEVGQEIDIRVCLKRH